MLKCIATILPIADLASIWKPTTLQNRCNNLKKPMRGSHFDPFDEHLGHKPPTERPMMGKASKNFYIFHVGVFADPAVEIFIHSIRSTSMRIGYGVLESLRMPEFSEYA